MPTPWRRGGYEKVEYVVVERDGATDEKESSEQPPVTVDRVLRRSQAKRYMPDSIVLDDTDNAQDVYPPTQATTVSPTPTLAMPVATGIPTLLITMTLNAPQFTQGAAFAENDPSETVVLAIPPPPEPPQTSASGISQTTEHLLIAAGSIGATIIIVMIVLALYTMRKRGLTFSDLISQSKNQIRRGPPPPPKYNQDTKEQFDDESTYGKTDAIYAPPAAAINTRSSALSSQKRLQALARSDSFHDQDLERNEPIDTSFYDDTPSRSNSRRKNDSPTPSSGILPIQDSRQSASTHNTRSLDGNEEPLRYSDSPAQPSSNTLPTPPTFKQFLSNRPSISQRPGMGGGGGIASRFSWTNSNAPQTPHDTARDTVHQAVNGRDSYMTSRSSVPRFRTVDSWVNQQSNRVEEQRLKQQFRMTQSTTYDDEDVVPEMPPVPKNANTMTRQASARIGAPALLRSGSNASGLVGKDIKHQRHDTTTTVQTAPIFKAHPGTEVRFSTRSAVPSEILDMGRKNAALE